LFNQFYICSICERQDAYFCHDIFTHLLS
jgi:hypothetical protein